MSASIWADIHGAATHFPVALTLCSGVCDGAGFVLAKKPSSRGLTATGYWTMLGAAAGTIPAVISGLIMTRGTLWGHGALRMHHLFIWPAFGLIIALATWRFFDHVHVTSVLSERSVEAEHSVARRPSFCIYLLGTLLAMSLMLGAGYWGGIMMNSAS